MRTLIGRSTLPDVRLSPAREVPRGALEDHPHRFRTHRDRSWRFYRVEDRLEEILRTATGSRPLAPPVVEAKDACVGSSHGADQDEKREEVAAELVAKAAPAAHAPTQAEPPIAQRREAPADTAAKAAVVSPEHREEIVSARRQFDGLIACAGTAGKARTIIDRIDLHR